MSQQENHGKRQRSAGVVPQQAEPKQCGTAIKINLTVSTNRAYYVPAKFGKLLSVVMLDSGCSRSIISRQLLRQLPESACGKTTPFDGCGILADGSKVELNQLITLHFRLGSRTIHHDFLVGDVAEHALLGLDFFEKQECAIDFRNCTFTCGSTKLSCCTETGEPLRISAQLQKETTIPPMHEKLVDVKLNRVWTQGTACLESSLNQPGLMVAASVQNPADQKLKVRILNGGTEPVTLPHGKIVATCCAVQSVEQPSDSPGQDTLQPHIDRWCADLTQRDREKVQNLLNAHTTVFSTGKYDLGRTDVVKHSIHTQPGTKPIKQRPYRHGPAQEEEIERQVKELAENGLISEGHGAWSSPVVLVLKKDQSWRFCVDYRKLNDVSQKDAYPLPRIDDSLDALGGSKLFSTLDLTSGYWQVELDDDAKEKSAFATRTGLWQWNVLPFGLTSAPSTFERLMETVLRGLHWRTLLIYLDDIIVFSKDLDSHLERLGEVFTRLETAGLKLKPEKCELFAKRVNYLGHVVSEHGVETDQEKIQSVKEWPVPRHPTDVRSFLGTTGYYRRFIPSYSEVARPLTQLSAVKPSDFIWTKECQRAFTQLKTHLSTAPILAYPDYSIPFILDTDASNVGCGAVLSQEQEGAERVIAYYSKMHSPEEINYCVTRQELLAIVKALKHFRPHLYGRRFTVRTDHASLAWLIRTPHPTNQLARWLELLSEFNFELIHRKGLKHNNADGLSRQECKDCKQCSRMFRLEERSDEQLIQQTSVSSLADMQKCDDEVGPVYRHVVSQEPIDISLHSSQTKKLLELKDKLSVSTDGVLLLSLESNQGVKQCKVCPTELRRKQVEATHRLAHLGFNKTLERLRLEWYWPGMSGDVRRHVNRCIPCQQSKPARHKNSSKANHLWAGRPWQTVAVDLCGPFPETERGNTEILVIADHFTRWYDAIPIPDGSAKTVAQVLDERVFSYYGIPETLHSDQGPQFVSDILLECCKLWGCDKTQSSPYHPQGNSVVERLNRTMGGSIRALLAGLEHREWDLLVHHVMRAIRASPHRITQETPNFMMFGRELRLPDSLLTGHTSLEQTDQEFVDQLQKNLAEVGRRLREQQWTLRTDMSEEPPLFKAGDKVWLKSFYKPKGRGAKLRPKYVGPYNITAALPYQTYEMERNGETSVQHQGRIKRYESVPAAEATQPLEPSQQSTVPASRTSSRQEIYDEQVHRQQLPVRPRRQIQKPRHLGDFLLDMVKAGCQQLSLHVKPILGQNLELEEDSVVKLQLTTPEQPTWSWQLDTSSIRTNSLA